MGGEDGLGKDGLGKDGWECEMCGPGERTQRSNGVSGSDVGVNRETLREDT